MWLYFYKIKKKKIRNHLVKNSTQHYNLQNGIQVCEENIEERKDRKRGEKPFVSGRKTLLVGTSGPWWSCLKSALMISTGKWDAKSMASSFNLPEPLGPIVITRFGLFGALCLPRPISILILFLLLPRSRDDGRFNCNNESW